MQKARRAGLRRTAAAERQCAASGGPRTLKRALRPSAATRPWARNGGAAKSARFRSSTAGPDFPCEAVGRGAAPAPRAKQKRRPSLARRGSPRSVRDLQRSLDDQGTSFTEIRRRVRVEYALELLTEGKTVVKGGGRGWPQPELLVEAGQGRDRPHRGPDCAGLDVDEPCPGLASERATEVQDQAVLEAVTGLEAVGARAQVADVELAARQSVAKLGEPCNRAGAASGFSYAAVSGSRVGRAPPRTRSRAPGDRRRVPLVETNASPTGCSNRNCAESRGLSMTRLSVALAFGSAATMGWPLVVAVFLVVVLVALCGVEYLDEGPGGRRRRFRIRRLRHPR
jgi:hypothetical protein